ncbi:hypothetical protein AB0K21_35480 [Streptosporangium sp. NPDC049248]|uniref:hypothetical protein n=1 Tax=Streptosporangium sp. NPDC049248 TaxID=3155651 RepID=UPI00343E2189
MIVGLVVGKSPWVFRYDPGTVLSSGSASAARRRQTIVSTVPPTIVSDLGGVKQLSWVVTAYMPASTVSTPLWGKLGEGAVPGRDRHLTRPA